MSISGLGPLLEGYKHYPWYADPLAVARRIDDIDRKWGGKGEKRTGRKGKERKEKYR